MNSSRRSVLELLGTGLTVGSIGTATIGGTAAADPTEGLRLFAEQPVDGAMEVVVDRHHAFVATGSGMAVVDVHNPGRPEIVAEVDLAADLREHLGIEDPAVDVLDVKVDDGVAALANNDGAENPGGVSLYDVRDPANPRFLAQYQPTFDDSGASPGADIHNCFLADGYAYLTLAEPWNVDTDGDGERDAFWLFGNAGVEIVDVGDPSTPEQASRWLLRDVEPEVAKASRVPCHDVYVQDDVCYAALWDAGTAALDVSDPADPTLVSRFGAAVDAGDAIPPFEVGGNFSRYLVETFDYAEYLTAPGNAHYVQPSSDGDHVYVGAETFPKDVGVSNPGVDDYGGITVFDTADLADPQEVTRIDPPVIDDDDSGKLFTSHNFDVTSNRLHTSWYHGGVHVYDVTDPAAPERLAGYDPDGYAFWTAVSHRGFTIGGVYGAESAVAGGVTVLHDDRGAKQPPAFDGSSPSDGPEVDPRAERA